MTDTSGITAQPLSLGVVVEPLRGDRVARRVVVLNVSLPLQLGRKNLQLDVREHGGRIGRGAWSLGGHSPDYLLLEPAQLFLEASASGDLLQVGLISTDNLQVRQGAGEPALLDVRLIPQYALARIDVDGRQNGVLVRAARLVETSESGQCHTEVVAINRLGWVEQDGSLRVRERLIDEGHIGRLHALGEQVEAQRAQRGGVLQPKIERLSEVRRCSGERLRGSNADEARSLRAGGAEDDSGTLSIGSGEGRAKLYRAVVVVLCHGKARRVEGS